MALREIRMLGDEMLTKPCRKVTEMTPRLQELVEDMLETMYHADGVGLAAPQVGVLRRIVVIDIWQEREEDAEEEEERTDAEEPGGMTEAPEPAEETAAGAEEAEPAEETAAGAEAQEPAEAEETTEPEEEEEPEDEEDFCGPLIMVNPVITRKEGEQTGDEGCLSYPGKVGTVTRPQLVEVTYFDENMDEYTLEAEGILARAICHEVDHLDGHMYVEFVEGEIRDAGYDASEEEEEEEEDGSVPDEPGKEKTASGEPGEEKELAAPGEPEKQGE